MTCHCVTAIVVVSECTILTSSVYSENNQRLMPVSSENMQSKTLIYLAKAIKDGETDSNLEPWQQGKESWSTIFSWRRLKL